MTRINNKHIRKNKSYTNFADDFEYKLTKAIEHGIINALKAFGADMDNQGEVQKDFHFLRYLRKRSEATSHITLKVIISIIIGASAVAIWEGLKLTVIASEAKQSQEACDDITPSVLRLPRRLRLLAMTFLN